ncbi:hypothetical protein [Streptomyces sp. NBC_00035]|uniref:hypothetical protein n=1 Tax=Streptomyces sp. NBC_00035 TaxID=2903614 RepID=UPI003243938F
MSEGAEGLADRLERQTFEIVDFLSRLTKSELEIPCPNEDAGPNVGAIAVHVAASFGRATVILQAAAPVPAGRVHDVPQALVQGHPHMGPRSGGGVEGSDVDATIRRIKDHGRELVDLVRSYPAYALRRPLPAGAARSANLGKPVGMIIEYMIYLQAAHLDTMRCAVADRRSGADGPQIEHGRSKDRFSA